MIEQDAIGLSELFALAGVICPEIACAAEII